MPRLRPTPLCRLSLALLSLVTALTAQAGPRVVISEIHFHPDTHRREQEFVEIHNAGDAPAALAGWTLEGGLSFSFPAVTLAPGAFLAVAADLPAFQARYPGVTNVVGAYAGQLSNREDRIDLLDASTTRVDRVEYADEGDWAVRQRGPLDYGHRGWAWYAAADGNGPSLELVNPALPGNNGQNWLPSAAVHGTPGAPNSRASTNTAPLILETRHVPAVPKAGDPIYITAEVRDEAATGLSVVLHYRIDGAPVFQTTPMLDDGLNGDGAPDDGLFGARLPGQPQGTLLEFYLRAVDASTNARTWPAAVQPENQQLANALLQVDSTAYNGTVPEYRLIMTEAERAELDALGNNSTESNSHAQMNGTFISRTPAGTEVRYLCGFRNRGSGSRMADPNNVRVNFRTDEKWEGEVAVNFNSRYIAAQVAGAALAPYGALAAAAAQPVEVRVNNADLAKNDTIMHGRYARVEVVDVEFLGRMFPDDANGNLYQGRRIVAPGADLRYQGTVTNNYRVNYFKQSNSAEDDWRDLIALTYNLSDNISAGAYTNLLAATINLDQWLDYLAFVTVMGSEETALGTGNGDDYFLYHPVADPRWLALPHDFDSILGQGGVTPNPTSDIYRAATNIAVLDRMMKHPSVAPRYHAKLLAALDGYFAPAELEPLLRAPLQGWAAESTIQSMLDYATQRRAHLRSVLPTALSAATGLPVTNGFATTTNDVVALTGRAHAARTRAVQVNGQPVPWTAWRSEWSAPAVPLRPGLNRLWIEALDEEGLVFDSLAVDVFRTPATNATVTANIATNTTWTVAGGPYEILNPISVLSAATLTIEPGVTVFFAPGAYLTVQGQLLALGDPYERIQMLPPPGAAPWGGLILQSTLADNRILNVDLHDSFSGNQSLHVNASRAWIEGCTWTGTGETILELTSASAVIRGNVFPSVVDNETIHGFGGILPGGEMIIQGNVFGTTTGYSDVIDFTGGQRPGPILQVLDNLFLGGSDDGLDLDGTDAHIEGNIFRDFAKQNTSDSSSNAIATGESGGVPAEITVVRNLFHNLDHAVLLKDGSSMIAEHNTFSGCRIAAVHFDEPNRPVTPGVGARFEGCIFTGNAEIFEDYYVNDPVEGTTALTIDRCLIPTFWHGYGSGNSAAAPLVADPLSREGHLHPGSPAVGSGRVGLDRGGAVPAGVAIGGLPGVTNTLASFTLEVYGPGLTHYRQALDGAPAGLPVPLSDPLELSALAPGPHQLVVEGLNSAGLWQPAVTTIWTRVASLPGDVRLSEVLAVNVAAFADGTNFPDYVELANLGGETVDLAGYGLTDDPTAPHRFVFPAGTLLPPGARLLVICAGSTNAPAQQAPFALDGAGETLRLHAPAALGGSLLDEVVFGPQIPDLSVSRLPDGGWTLSHPTPNAANAPRGSAPPDLVVINEWRANNSTLTDDFVELFNAGPEPVQLAGCGLTDLPASRPDRYVFPPLSFLDAGAHLALWADDSAAAGHLPFSLEGDAGEIALFDSSGALLDAIAYGTSPADSATGRAPSGAATITLLDTPTPGAANPEPAQPNGVVVAQTHLAITNTWAYWQQTAAPAATWRQPAFDDSAWPRGAGLLYVETAALPAPKTTPLAIGPATFYFRDAFTLPDLPPNASVTIRGVLDDGVILYLNGVEIRRLGMPAGTVTHTTLASRNVGDAVYETLAVLPASSFLPGENHLAAELHQGTANSGDIVFGLELQSTYTNIVARPRISEVLAAGPGPDWVEICNPGVTPLDLTGYGLTDTPAQPFKWTAPAGLVIPPGDCLRVFLQTTVPASATNAPFALDRDGEAVLLHTPASRGGVLEDAVFFGPQVPGFSIARLPDLAGGFALAQPTPLAPNVAQPTGSPFALRLNEWMATPLTGDDWFELFNPGALPVDLTGMTLTDSLSNRDKFPVPALSFIGAGITNAYLVYLADDKTASGPAHTNFKLSGGGEALGLFTAEGVQVDAVVFGAQTTGVSQGRYPDGGPTIGFFPGNPTRGAANKPADSDNDLMPDPYETANGFNPNDPADALLDADSDGLSNLDEYQRDTLPRDSDSDDDGMNDGYEVAYLLNPLFDDRFADADGDTLSNLAEYTAGTRPDLADTDGDDMNDGYEVANGLNPIVPDGAGDLDSDGLSNLDEHNLGADPDNPDSDNDGLNDGDEITAGTGLLDSDSDNDGMPDGFEVTHTLNPLASDASGDLDGDGLTNLQEYQAGTSPRLRDSDGDRLTDGWEAHHFGAGTTAVIPFGATWRYLGTGADPGPDWKSAAFDDAAWPSGRAQLGFGEGDEATVVTHGLPPPQVPMTTYFRATFHILNLAEIASGFLRVYRDDGVAIHLNGVEVGRNNLPAGPLSNATPALTASEGVPANQVQVSVPAARFVAGWNVLAVEVHQNVDTSDDLSFDLTLLINRLATPALPGGDLDGDGFDHLQEFMFGTDPRVANPPDVVLRLQPSGSGHILQIPTLPAAGPGYGGLLRRYTLERSLTLQPGSWSPVSGFNRVIGNGQLLQLNSSSWTPGPRAYFRVGVEVE